MYTTELEVVAPVVEVEQAGQVAAAMELLDSQLSLIGGGFGGVPLF